jgi:hypothetical protein
MATMAMAKQMTCDPTPQQVAEKKLLFKAAAKPASRHATGDKFNDRQKNHADSPITRSEIGTKNLAKPNGPRMTRNMVVTPSGAEGNCTPGVFKSSHQPVHASGTRALALASKP